MLRKRNKIYFSIRLVFLKRNSITDQHQARSRGHGSSPADTLLLQAHGTGALNLNQGLVGRRGSRKKCTRKVSVKTFYFY